MESGKSGIFDKTPTSGSPDDGLLRYVKIVSIFFLIRLWAKGKVAFSVLEALMISEALPVSTYQYSLTTM